MIYRHRTVKFNTKLSKTSTLLPRSVWNGHLCRLLLFERGQMCRLEDSGWRGKGGWAPSEPSAPHPAHVLALASWRRARRNQWHRGTPSATGANSTWSRGGRPGPGAAWLTGPGWRWCCWRAGGRRASPTQIYPPLLPSLLRESSGWFWCAAKMWLRFSEQEDFAKISRQRNYASSPPAQPGCLESLDTWWPATASGNWTTSDPRRCETERYGSHLLSEWGLGGGAAVGHKNQENRCGCVLLWFCNFFFAILGSLFHNRKWGIL